MPPPSPLTASSSSSSSSSAGTAKLARSRTQTYTAKPAACAAVLTPTCSPGLALLAHFKTRTCISTRVKCATPRESLTPNRVLKGCTAAASTSWPSPSTSLVTKQSDTKYSFPPASINGRCRVSFSHSSSRALEAGHALPHWPHVLRYMIVQRRCQQLDVER